VKVEYIKMKNESFKVIGLTGGIGSGKSTVSAYLAKSGCAVIDADKIAKEIVEPGKPILSELVAVFGKSIVNSDGTLHRKKLGDIIFEDEDSRKFVNEIMHKEIIRIIKVRIDEFRLSSYNNNIIILDIPLLFETAKDELADVIEQIWVVDADKEVRINRILKRDNVTCEYVLKIMNKQMSSEEKRKKADVVIENSGNEEALFKQLDDLLILFST